MISIFENIIFKKFITLNEFFIERKIRITAPINKMDKLKFINYNLLNYPFLLPIIIRNNF